MNSDATKFAVEIIELKRIKILNEQSYNFTIKKKNKIIEQHVFHCPS